MERYEAPVIDIIEFETQDIMTVSELPEAGFQQ